MNTKVSWTKTLNKDRASGVIIKDNNILLIHRIREGKEYWVLPGGGVEKNETIEEALDREMHEELEIKVKEKKLLFEIKNAGRTEYHFFITAYEGEIDKIQGPEKEHMNIENQYILECIDLSRISNLSNFYPQEAIVKLKESLQTQK